MPRYRCLWVSMTMLCASGGVAAQPVDSPITLWWEVPPGSECPSGDVVSAEVERLLGGKPSASTGRRLFARAKVGRREDGSWTLAMRTAIAGEEADGERSLEAPSCEGLAGAAALIVALGFDPAAVAAQAERAASAGANPGNSPDNSPTQVEDAPPGDARGGELKPMPSAGSRAASGPPAAPHGVPGLPGAPRAAPRRAPAEAPAQSASGVHLGLGAGVGGDLGSLAAPAFAVQASGSLRYRKLRLALSGAYLLPQPIPTVERPTAGGKLSLIAGELSACGQVQSWLTGALGLAACGGAEMGQMHAAGYGVRSPDEAAELWLALRAGIALTVVLPGAVHVRVDAGAAVPFTRSRFVLENVGMVHEPGPVAGRLALGVDYYFF